MPGLPLVSKPDQIDGDENKYLWSTRFPESIHQKLSDLGSEYNLNKAGLMREMVYFAIEYLPKVADLLGVDVSKKLRASSKSKMATREQDQRKAAYTEIIDLLTRAAGESYKPLEVKLKLAAKEIAEAWRISFPPPDLPLDVANQDAAHVLKKIKKVMGEKQMSRVRLNELNPRVHQFKADKLREIIAQLEEHGYVVTNEEATSGPSTLWISLPSYEYVRD